MTVLMAAAMPVVGSALRSGPDLAIDPLPESVAPAVAGLGLIMACAASGWWLGPRATVGKRWVIVAAVVGFVVVAAAWTVVITGVALVTGGTTWASFIPIDKGLIVAATVAPFGIAIGLPTATVWYAMVRLIARRALGPGRRGGAWGRPGMAE